MKKYSLQKFNVFDSAVQRPVELYQIMTFRKPVGVIRVEKEAELIIELLNLYEETNEFRKANSTSS